MKITKATRFNILVTSVFSLKYFANVAAIYVCKATIIQTPIENIKLRLWPSFKLILAADIFNIPGGITPKNEITRPTKNINVISNLNLI